MIIKSQKSPEEVAESLLNRSSCSVQVAAILVDKWGIFAWGWNSMGPDGRGQHAEDHCLKRANKSRLANAIMYVCARRTRNKKIVTAKPCEQCQPKLKNIGTVCYRDKDGMWNIL